MSEFRVDLSRLRDVDPLAFNDSKNPYADDSVRSAFRNKDEESYRKEVRNSGVVGHKRVLDLLCGAGRWSFFLAEQNEEVIGLDKNAGAIRVARGMKEALGADNVEFRVGDFSATREFPDGHFDAVWMWQALVYVDRGACLREVHRVLCPDGLLFVGAMNAGGRMLQKLRFGLKGLRGRHRGNRDQALAAFWHGTRFDGAPNYATSRTVRPIFERHGFQVERVEAHGGKVLGRIPVNLHVKARRIEIPERPASR